MAVAGVLEIQMLIELGRLRSDLDEVKSRINQTAEHVNGAVEGMKHALEALGIGLSVEFFKGLVEGSIEAADHLGHLAKSTDLTVETLSGLSVVSKIINVDVDTTAKAINKLSQEIGKSPEKFRALGISAKDPLEALKQLADIYTQIEDPQQRAAVAAGALGKQWQSLAPLLAMGGDRLGDLIEKGSKASGITEEMAHNAEELHEKWVLLFGSGGMVNRVVGEMQPWLIKLVDEFKAAKDAADGFLGAMGRFALLQASGSTASPAAQIENIDVKLVALRKTVADMEGMSPWVKWFSADDIAIAKTQIALLETQRETLAKLNQESEEGDHKPTDSGRSRTPKPTNQAIRNFIDDKNSAVQMGAELRGLYEANVTQRLAIENQFGETMHGLRDKFIDAQLQQEMQAGDRMKALYEAEVENRLKIEIASGERMAALFDEAKSQGKDIADSLMTISESETQAYDLRLANLNAYLAASNASEQLAADMRQRLQIDHEAKLGSITAQAALQRKQFAELTMTQQVQGIAGILTTLTATSAQKNREMFELNKVASMANAIIYTYEGANKALSLGPWGIPLAAIIIAAGLANVAQIASTSFGSGAAPSAGGGGPGVVPTSNVPTVNDQQAFPQTTIVDFHGTQDERMLIKRFAEMLNENTRDGGRVVIPDK